MTHTEYFDSCIDSANETANPDVRIVHLLASIAESLAAIADILEFRETDSEKETT